MEPGPGGGGDQLHLGVGQDPVTAERAAEQAGRHDGHALGMQAPPWTWAPWTHTRGWCGALLHLATTQTGVLHQSP